MLCSNCLSKDANFHYKYIENGKVTEVHLCTECAKSLGYIKESEPDFDPSLFLGELLSMPHISHISPAKDVCSVCKTPFETIRRTGFAGCDKCYDNFSSLIDSMLSKIQPSTRHKGKLHGKDGKKIEREMNLKNLKQDLQKAIMEEKYEEAAVLRDKIKALESGEEKNNG